MLILAGVTAEDPPQQKHSEFSIPQFINEFTVDSPSTKSLEHSCCPMALQLLA
jgi:hypothetical protein